MEVSVALIRPRVLRPALETCHMWQPGMRNYENEDAVTQDLKHAEGLTPRSSVIAGRRLQIFEEISLMEFDSPRNQAMIGLRPET